MDPDEAVVEADGYLVGAEDVVLDPVAGVGEELTDVLDDAPMGYADVPVGVPIAPGPTPDVAEHSTMELADEAVADDLGGGQSAAGRPNLGASDVLLFRLVEVFTRRNPVAATSTSVSASRTMARSTLEASWRRRPFASG